MRVVGDKGAETAKKLAPLLILPPPGLTYEYLETLEALTISERRVAFCLLKPAVSLEALSAQAVAALDALESPRCTSLATAPAPPRHSLCKPRSRPRLHRSPSHRQLPMLRTVRLSRFESSSRVAAQRLS